MRWSHSSLADVELCPWKAMRSKHAGKGGTSLPVESGQICHKVAEALAGLSSAALAGTDEETVRIVKDTFRRVAAESGASQDAIADAETVIDKWIQDRLIDPDWPCGGRAEVKFAFDARWRTVDFDAPTARFRGIIDHILLDLGMASAILTDYKTGHVMPVTPDWRQLERCAVAVFEEFPSLRTITLRYDFMRVGWRPTRDISRDQLDQIKADITAAMRAADALFSTFAETGHMPAKPNRFCGSCAHRATCPALQELIGIASVQRELLPAACLTDAESTANYIRLLEGALEDARGVLKTWTIENGPVTDQEGRTWETKVSQRQNRPVQTMRSRQSK